MAASSSAARKPITWAWLIAFCRWMRSRYLRSQGGIHNGDQSQSESTTELLAGGNQARGQPLISFLDASHGCTCHGGKGQAQTDPDQQGRGKDIPKGPPGRDQRGQGDAKGEQEHAENERRLEFPGD